MFFTCNLFIRGMQIKWCKRIPAIGILLTCSVAIVVGWAFSKRQSETGIICSAERKIHGGTVKVDVIRPAANSIAVVPDSFYFCRIKVSTAWGFKQQNITQYMQSGILQCFYAVSQGDTLHPASIEIVPGINRNDFVYMACFRRNAAKQKNSFELLLADSIAGFGITSVILYPAY